MLTGAGCLHGLYVYIEVGLSLGVASKWVFTVCIAVYKCFSYSGGVEYKAYTLSSLTLARYQLTCANCEECFSVTMTG